MKATSETSTLLRVATARMPTKWGMFGAIGFKREIAGGVPGLETALAFVMGDLSEDAPLLWIHSQCFTGEALGSLRCDCGDQLAMALQAVADEGRGLVIYESQEGRGIGLMAKLQANRTLGFKADYRDFSLPAAILRDLCVRRVRLLTNNPHKVHALTDAGIEVVAQIPCEAAPTSHSLAYLRTKKERMGHALSLRPSRAASDKFAWRGSDYSRTVGAAREI
jgi:3,4-dihydroxy 2-butanone 4-phosphate synthase/GTP cyclohydrolase II